MPTDSLREYYFSREPGVVRLELIELRHPAFMDGDTNVAVRFVNNQDDIALTMEADAPMNAGETVTFKAGAFAATPPEQASPGLPTCGLEVDNVGAILMPYMTAAAASNDPIELSYREARSDELDAPALSVHGMTIKSARAGVQRVTAQAGFEDLLNKPHPADVISLQDYPGLANL